MITEDDAERLRKTMADDSASFGFNKRLPKTKCSKEIMEISNIDHPPHYKSNGIEAIDVIEAFDLNFCLGNAIKYILRAGRKSEDATDDLNKAIWYIKRHIKYGISEEE